jgi:N6-adenosine-specific RNA methylase IME4
MTIKEIEELPVQRVSAPGSHLYLWTTNRYLDLAFHVARRWGFEPITTLVWCKVPKGIGPGGCYSVTTEFVLFCRDRRRAGAAILQARVSAGLGRADLHRLVRGDEPTGIVYRWEADDSVPSPEDWDKLTALLPRLAGVPYPSVVDPGIGRSETTWFRWPRGPHSQKPDAFYDLVGRVSPGPYADLFARAPRLGWDHWGHGYEIAALSAEAGDTDGD